MSAEIMLSTIGSRITLGVAPAALREAQGGAQIELGLHDGPLIVTLTRDEARWLGGRLLDPEAYAGSMLSRTGKSAA